LEQQNQQDEEKERLYVEFMVILGIHHDLVHDLVHDQEQFENAREVLVKVLQVHHMQHGVQYLVEN